MFQKMWTLNGPPGLTEGHSHQPKCMENPSAREQRPPGAREGIHNVRQCDSVKYEEKNPRTPCSKKGEVSVSITAHFDHLLRAPGDETDVTSLHP